MDAHNRRHPEDAPRALVADDDPIVRHFTAETLTLAGYEVIEAEDGADALAQLEDQAGEEIDVVVSDVVMPRLGGIALARRLRHMWPRLPVVLISAGAAPQDAEPAIDERHPFLPKPFTQRQLLETVEHARKAS